MLRVLSPLQVDVVMSPSRSGEALQMQAAADDPLLEMHVAMSTMQDRQVNHLRELFACFKDAGMVTECCF